MQYKKKIRGEHRNYRSERRNTMDNVEKYKEKIGNDNRVFFFFFKYGLMEK